MNDLVKSFQELTMEQQVYAGGKGGSLAKLCQAGFPVPDGFVILPGAFVDDELVPEAWTQVEAHLNRLRGLQGETAFAVRSSAMGEDSTQASFAGEFETVLNVHTDEEIHRAIQTVYSSRQNERVQAYSQARGMVPAGAGGWHEIAVIVQELVPAESSGVLFTAHPVTGRRDQAMINAAWGLGEAIVGGLVTPDTIVVDKQTGQVVHRETPDKRVMTVLEASGTEERPVPETKRQAAVLSDEQAAELMRWGVKIEALYGLPMDVEWVRVEKEAAGVSAWPTPFAIVQARPITALPEPQAPVPTEWKLPKGSYTAVRNNIVELMADPLTPLFSTLGLAAINRSMNRLMAGFFGRSDLMPDEIIITVNEYAYYNGSWSAGQLLRILLNSVGITRHMFTGAVERWTDDGRPRYVTTVEQWQTQPWRDQSATELLESVRELFEAAIDAYLSLVSGVIPAAWISEGLFTFAYKTLIKRRDDPAAPTYLLGFDSLPIQAEKSLYDLATWARSREGLAAYLERTSAAELAAQLEDGPAPPDVAGDDWREWQEQFQAHLRKYGHTIYNLDFANPVPADDPVPLLQTFKWFLAGEGVNPHRRQETATQRREEVTETTLSRLKGLRLKVFRNLLEKAQRYAPLREDGLAEVGLSYPLLRQMLREVGRRFVEGGLIETPHDVYWLKQDEAEQAAARLDRGQALQSLALLIPQRRAVWRAANRATPPRALSPFKSRGKGKRAIADGRKEETLKGVAASPGTVTAPARVVTGPEDFSQMQAGDVLVAALTTPAWTPLFARAAAVVTDIGGPLSHGSIVAREYGIPAVLGTGEATKRIHSGQVVTVDGSAGVVTLRSLP
jgi:phosphohistidine swiveling domain-containing protein